MVTTKKCTYIQIFVCVCMPNKYITTKCSISQCTHKHTSFLSYYSVCIFRLVFFLCFWSSCLLALALPYQAIPKPLTMLKIKFVPQILFAHTHTHKVCPNGKQWRAHSSQAYRNKAAKRYWKCVRHRFLITHTPFMVRGQRHIIPKLGHIQQHLLTSMANYTEMCDKETRGKTGAQCSRDGWKGSGESESEQRRWDIDSQYPISY